MTSIACPSCRHLLTGAATCTACGLRLTGPEAVRLWDVDVALERLDGQRAALLAERRGLIAALRGELSASSSAAAGPLTGESTPAAMNWTPSVAPASSRPEGTARVAPIATQEWTPQRVQNTLLGLGGLLLTVAGIVFAAVTYDRLGAGGRAAVLVALTTLVGLAVPRVRARGLEATAETLATVTLALAALDAYGLRTLGLAESTDALTYAAGSCVALALSCGLYGALVQVRLPRFAGVLLAQLPFPLLMASHHASAGVGGLSLAALAVVDAAAAAVLARQPGASWRRDVQGTAIVCAAAAAICALPAALAGAFMTDGRGPGVTALLVLAGLAAGCGVLLSDVARLVAHALPAPLVAAAALALSTDLTTSVQRPVVFAAVGLIAMQVAALLTYDWRPGPVVGALVTITLGVATQAEALAQAVVLPLSWLVDPWTLSAGRDARHALSPHEAWDGTVVTLVVIAAAAVAVAAAGLALHRMRLALPVAAGLVVVAAVVLPLGVATSYPLALVLLLAVAVALTTAGMVLARTDVSIACIAAGGLTALLAGVWAAADQQATLLVLPVVAIAFAAAATRRPEAATAAGITVSAFLAAAGAARELSADQVGGLLLVAPAALVALTFVLDAARRLAVEAAAAVLATTAVVLTVGDVGWLSWALAGAALIALADALHPDRRAVAAAGGLLLAASSWVRLADAGVSAPEPYVLPLAVVALGLGHLRFRRTPGTRSFAAYGPGLSALLLPSLLASLDDDTLVRPLLLGAAATAVLLIGAHQRLQAPIVVGGATLVLDALHLLTPYAAALPRWTTLGAAGLLLVGVGATYEQRRQDLSRMRERFDALA